METIDLRSDTVTQPTPEMRRVMAEAPVGDDVFGDDPSVNRLQERAAEMVGMEAALFVPSGTMANLCAILSLTRPGDEVLLEKKAHLFNYEAASGPAIAGVQYHPLPGRRGVLDVAEVEAAIRPPDAHFPRTALVCIENTHNGHGGTIYPLEAMRELRDFCRERDLPVHLDGARIFNASVATGIPVPEYTKHVSSLSFCLSKGLGAPVGSLVCGPRSFISRCHSHRKRLGGGMRQAGVIAAAGLHALENHVERLAEDHANAKFLAEGLAQIEGFRVETPVETNMVYFRVGDAEATAAFRFAMRDRGVLFTGTRDRIRAIPHLGVERHHLERVLELAAECREASATP